MKGLALREKNCQLCELDLKTTRATLKETLAQKQEVSLWQEPVFVVGGITVGVGVGILIGSLLIK